MRLSDLPVGFEFPDAHGYLSVWSAAANRLFAQGCEAQAFALLASFAAPLMNMIRTDEGGAIVSIVGGKKSGKTVAHMAAATVWGDPENYSLTEFAGATRYLHLCQLVNLPAFDDSLASRDPDIVRMFLANVVRRNKDEWRTILISFSPRSIFDGSLVTQLGVELAVAVPKTLQVWHAKNRDPLLYDLHDNRGTAGSAYIKYLTLPETQKWASRMISAQIAALRDAGADEEQRYAMRVIACCHVAGLICVKLGILEFEPDRITRWVRECALPALAPHPQPAG